MKIEEKDGGFVITDFDEIEAYKIASKIEQDGIDFYNKMSAEVKDPGAKEKIDYLLSEEKKHLRFFQERLAEISRENCGGFEEDNLLGYMDYEVFRPFREARGLPENIKDAKKALKLGIIAETGSINFYISLKDKISSPKAKEELSQIIEEEKMHRELFENLLSRA